MKSKINLNDLIVKVQDYPKPGIIFSDISHIIENPQAFSYVVDELCEYAKKFKPTMIVGIEARGFIFGTAMAYKLGVGFATVRKPNKLPRAVVSASASIEYAERTLSMHRDSLRTGERVVVVDDILATGGTVLATIEIVKQLRANVVSIAFLGRIKDLHGDEKLKGYEVKWLIDL